MWGETAVQPRQKDNEKLNIRMRIQEKNLGILRCTFARLSKGYRNIPTFKKGKKKRK